MGSPSSSSAYTVNPASKTYYKAVVTCNGNSQRSTPLEVVVNPALPGGTYTIDPGQAAGSSNFQTLTAAVNALSCGVAGPVIFNVSAGATFTDQVVIPELNGTSSANTVTFNGNGAMINYTAPDAANRTAVIFNGADHVTFNNFIIDASAGTYGWGMVLTNQADSNTITNCTIRTSNSSTSSNYLGFAINGSTTSTNSSGNNGNGNTISGNTIIGGYYTMLIYGSTTSLNEGNKIMNNILQDAYYHSLYTYGNTGLLLSRNDMSRPNRTNPTSGYGIYTGSNVETLIEKNRIHNMFDAAPTSTSYCYAIYVSGSGSSSTSPNKIENNLIYNMNNASGTLYGIYATSCNNWDYYHNTIVFDYASATSGTTYGIYAYGSGVNVKNNIVYITRGGTGTKYCLYYSTTGVGSSDNNDLYMNSTAGTNNLAYYKGAFATLADWQAANASVYGQQSKDADPGFTNPGGGDFKPTNALMDNMGTPVGVLKDIANVNRSTSAPDAGAYEFSGPTCSTPPTAGSAVSNATGEACPGSTITLDLSGNSIGATQKYQWESSSTQNGTYTNISGLLDAPSFDINPNSSLWYRAKVTCNGQTTTSTAVQVLVAALYPGGTYTINNTAATGSGNFNSFADAISAIRCGVSGSVTFNVAATATPYTEQITIPQINGASKANKITFNGNGAQINYTAPDAANRTAVIFDGADHVVFDNFTIDASAGTYGWGMVLTNRADSNSITNCIIRTSNSSTSSNYLGFAINGSTTSISTSGNNGNGNTISGNTIIGGYYAVLIYGSTSEINEGNALSNNIIQDAYLYSVYSYGNSGLILGRNNISRPARTNPSSGYGIYSNANVKVLIEKNRIHNLFDGNTTSTSLSYPIYVNGNGISAAEPNRVENNLIYNINNGGGGTIYGIYGPGDANWNYYHNTIVLDDATALSGTTYGMYVYGAGINVKNNIVYVSRGGTGTKYCLYYSSTGVGESNNNDLFMNSTAGTNNIAYYNSAFATLADWKAGNSGVYGQQSLDVDPNFTDPANGNYKPSAGSFDNQGSFVGVTTDINNNTRSNTQPDIGAYVFGTVPLPVVLADFFARHHGATNLLSWTTMQEINSNYFELEHSTDGSSFTSLARISAAGNSATRLDYRYTHAGPIKGMNFYRLKMVDRDNSVSYSAIRSLRNGGATSLNLYPNPAHDMLNLEFSAAKAGKVELSIIDLSGRIIKTSNLQILQGMNTMKYQIPDLQPGTYVLKIQSADQKMLVNFVKL